MKAARSLVLNTISIAALTACFAGLASAELVWKPPKRATPLAESAVQQTSLIETEANTSAVEQTPGPEVIPAPEAVGPEFGPDQGTLFTPQITEPVGEPWEMAPPGAYPPGVYDDAYGGCEPCGGCYVGGRGPWVGGRLRSLLCNMSFFGGIHGFKGPVDAGQNGNFGFHEGLNFGAPLGDPWGYGYQLGFQAVHSDLSGSQIIIPNSGTALSAGSRTQIFFTGGVFRRVEEGLQAGVAFDYVHDSFYERGDLRQIRSETALVFGQGFHELGYWGAYGIDRERFEIDGQIIFLRPNDIFAGFYRRHFTGGGQGRIWAGVTGAGQAIIGGEATVPMGTNWALENNFAYVIPKTSATADGLGGQIDETWSVTISLVWYPGRPARSVFCDPYQPLFGVGDNSALLVRR